MEETITVKIFCHDGSYRVINILRVAKQHLTSIIAHLEGDNAKYHVIL